LNFNAVDNTGLGMTHSVVDVSGVDHDGDGIVSRIYFGDLGGNVFALKDDAAQDFTVCGETVSRVVVDGNWAGKKLFSASADDLVQRKILYAPDVVEEAFGEYIYFGTGDRTNPGKTTVVDRFYAVKNDWSNVAILTESDLVDVSDNLIQQGNETEQAAAKADLENGSGWFLEMENTGEKVVSSPRVYGGIVYFTTYTPSPEEADDPEDPCVASTVRGIARLYALEYKTGAAVHDWNSDSVTNDDGDQLWVDKDGNVSADPDLDNPAKGWKKLTLDKKDRALEIGTAIPSASVIAILNAGARLFVGVEGGIVSLPTIATQDMYRYFWNQAF
jgi:type IV pilus assembly protein PilY1